MNTDRMESYLKRDRAFLRELYETQSKPACYRILNFTSDIKLNTLIRLLHFISNGEITIKKKNFEIISGARKLSFIKKHVEKKSALVRLLQAERPEKLKFLKQLSAIYPALLYCLFNED